MKKYGLLIAICILTSLILPGSLSAQTTSLSTTFTYQGHLTGANGAVSGACDFQFSLYDALTSGTQVGSTITSTNVTVANGTFSAALDFGATAFDGTDRYLEIAVRCPAGSGSYTTLAPRQTVTAAPYALGLYGLEVQYNVTSPNLIGGINGNNVTAGVVGATISGGGEPGLFNSVTDNYSTVSGGGNNRAGNNSGTLSDSYYATVSGGRNNSANSEGTTVSGGYSNTASSSASTVGGGSSNMAQGNYATIGGGLSNTTSGGASTVGGGDTNTAEGNYATIGGGRNNTTLGDYDLYATIGGGYSNTASGSSSTVGGGYSNTASGHYATVSGGLSNTASGLWSTVAGGEYSVASGTNSFAAGQRAQANHDGAFVWAGYTNFNFFSTAANEFSVRAVGGARFVSGIDGSGAPTSGVNLAAGGGSWSSISDRNVKENIAPVDPQAILQNVADMPIATWNYISQEDEIRHIGPMAQDFHAAFGVGEDDTHITTIDADGVALAAIQGLNQIVEDQRAEIDDLQAENSALKSRLDDIESRLSAVESVVQPINESSLMIPALIFSVLAFIWRRKG